MAQRYEDTNKLTLINDGGDDTNTESHEIHKSSTDRRENISENVLNIESSQIGFETNIETGQSATLPSNVVDCPLSMFGNRDLMSIIMKRQVGGSSVNRDSETKTDVKNTGADIDDRIAGVDIDYRKTAVDIYDRETGVDNHKSKTSVDIDDRKIGADIDDKKIGVDIDDRKTGEININTEVRYACVDIDTKIRNVDNVSNTAVKKTNVAPNIIVEQTLLSVENEEKDFTSSYASVSVKNEAEDMKKCNKDNVEVELEQDIAKVNICKYTETNESHQMPDGETIHTEKDILIDNNYDNEISISTNEADTEKSFREINMDIDLLNGCLEPSDQFGIVKYTNKPKVKETQEKEHIMNKVVEKIKESNQDVTEIDKEIQEAEIPSNSESDVYRDIEKDKQFDGDKKNMTVGVKKFDTIKSDIDLNTKKEKTTDVNRDKVNDDQFEVSTEGLTESLRKNESEQCSNLEFLVKCNKDMRAYEVQRHAYPYCTESKDSESESDTGSIKTSMQIKLDVKNNKSDSKKHLRKSATDSSIEKRANIHRATPTDLEVLATAAEERHQVKAKKKLLHESGAVDGDSDNNKGTSVEFDKKKSRKQNAPKRISQISNSLISKVMEENERKFGSDEEREAGKDEDNVKSKIEKSRKQNAPKRISHSHEDLFGKMLRLEQDADNDLDETIDNKKKEKSRKSKKSKYFETDFDQEENKFNIVVKTEKPDYSETEDWYQSEGGNSKDSYQNAYQTAFLNGETGMENYTHTAVNLQYGRNQNQTFQYEKEKNVNFSPFHNEMLETLSKSCLKSSKTENEKISLGNIEENLDIVRKLREIRYYKYRKITMTEKQEIASYAKQYGVSSAAIQFGVSKSAVSMWTRIDLTNMKSEAKKKNCMLGNEKFELLIERVKAEKGNKFKGLAKQDKYEVSRYAKLVGVREMARCLDIALGTVSGWMRQFPYTVKSTNQDEDSSDIANGMTQDSLVNESQESNTEYGSSEKSNEEFDDSTSQENDGTFRKIKIEKIDYSDEEVSRTGKEENGTLRNEMDNYKIEYDHDNSNSIGTESNTDDELIKGHVKPKRKHSSIGIVSDGSECCGGKKMKKAPSPEINAEEEKADEVDSMIAETLVAPDIDKLLEDLKINIKDTVLENDDFFENLFKRVVSCKADKYKTLKASEKIEVVRYAKRIGVRRVAKLLGLATGTLSGWNTKYQQLLGLTMDGIPQLDDSITSENQPSTSVGISGMKNETSSDNVTHIPTSSFAALDNAEKSEVTAIKFLLKEQYPLLLKKIEIAKQVKFRNMFSSEKIEIVKCAKLVGIRPTARVLGMPIGTLSGWITKYTGTLHPVYHVDDPEPMTYKPPALPEPYNSFSGGHELFSKEIVSGNLPIYDAALTDMNPQKAFSTSLLEANQTSSIQSSSNSSTLDQSDPSQNLDYRPFNNSHALMNNLSSDTVLNEGATEKTNSDFRNNALVITKVPNSMDCGNIVDGFTDVEASKMADHYVRLFQESQQQKLT